LLRVKVDYLGSIKQTLGLKHTEKIELKDDSLVRDLLCILAERHGDPFREVVYEPKDIDLKSHHILAINGLLLNQLEGVKTKLRDGDHVVLMPVVTGG
jgi:MoaD family protein